MNNDGVITIFYTNEHLQASQPRVGKKEPSTRLESKDDLREEAGDELNYESSEESFNENETPEHANNQEEDKERNQEYSGNYSIEEDIDEKGGLYNQPEDNKVEPMISTSLISPKEFDIRCKEKLSVLNQTKRVRLHSLFLRYSDFVEEAGRFFMKSRSYIRLLLDSGILDITTSFNKVKATIIYTSLAKKQKFGINFNIFLNCLFKIAEVIYPELAKEKRSNAFNYLVNEKMLPFKEQICNSRSHNYRPLSGVSIITNHLIYDASVKELMSYSIPALKGIYDAYFFELTKADQDNVIDLAVKKLIGLLKDYELLGQYIQKQSAIMLLDEVMSTPSDELTNYEEYVLDIDEEDYGAYLTFSCFLILLFWISVIGFDNNKSNHEEYSPAEKLYCLLMKMEESKEFIKRSKKALVKPEQIPHKLIDNNSLDKSAKRGKQGTSIKIESDMISVMESASTEEKASIEECKERLKQIFMWYCSLTESGNENKMTLTKLLLFAKDSGVLVDSLDIAESKCNYIYYYSSG